MSAKKHKLASTQEPLTESAVDPSVNQTTDTNTDTTDSQTQTQTTSLHPVLTDITPEQQQVLDELRDRYDDHIVAEANRRYEIGTLANKYWQKYKTKGQKTIPNICEALSISINTLYQWSRVARTFPPDEFRKHLQTRTCHGNRLTWNHLSHVAGFKDRSTIEYFLDLSVREDYSSEELRRMIRSRKDLRNDSFEIPEDFDLRVALYWLKRTRRTADKLKDLLLGTFNLLINQITWSDLRKLPKKAVREVRACQVTFLGLEEAMFDGIDSQSVQCRVIADEAEKEERMDRAEESRRHLREWFSPGGLWYKGEKTGEAALENEDEEDEGPEAVYKWVPNGGMKLVNEWDDDEDG